MCQKNRPFGTLHPLLKVDGVVDVGCVAGDLAADVLHFHVQLGAGSRALEEFFDEAVVDVRGQFFFVFELVLQAGPEVHGDGAQLDFDLHVALFVLQEDRHGNDQVETAVAVRLRVLDVVFAVDELDVVLLQDAVGDGVDVLREAADDTDSGDVLDFILDVLKGRFDIVQMGLGHKTVKGFEPRLDGLNRAVLAGQFKLGVEHLEFCLDLHQGALIVSHERLKILAVLFK